MKTNKILDRYNNSEAGASWFGECCGATWTKQPTEKTDLKKGHKGIRVLVGKHGEEYIGPKQRVQHVETKNGILTIGIRTEF